ncbi:MAG: PCMD domain-containing protein, partial [Muribaculaceae bacterium]|nr:PCMD domain-containing protein [Muribaculaceae bacterium]
SPVFVEPNNADLTVHFTTKGKDFNSAVKVGEFPPMAKTLHNITLDIVENPVGDAQLQVSFDDTLDDEDIFIDLTKELLTTPAPMISCQGFTSGETIDMLEGSSSANDLKMIVNSGDTIKSAILTVESNKFRPGWGNQIDLCKANKDEKDQIEAAGISAIGFGFKGQISNIAELDITNFGKSLPAGSHTISLQVIDQFDIPSNVVSVVLDSQPIVVDLVGTPTMVYGSRTAEVTIDYNGINPQTDISVQAVSEMGNYVNAEVLSFEEVAASRAIEKKQYKYCVKFPNNVTTARETLPIKIFHGTIEKVACELDIVVPDYNLEYDAYTDHAYVRVNVLGSTDPVVEETILENIWLYINGEQNTSDVVADYDHKVLAIGNLTPATQYRISSSITKGDSSKQNGSFTTESKLGIPNGTFEGKGDYYAMSGLQVGGQYSVSPVNYHHTSSFSVLEPADWATVNTKTAWKDSQNKNTWFIVPSSWLDDSSKRGVMRNVGYNHNGTTPGKSGGAFNTTYYCTNAPTSQQLEKAAGELFLGTYLFNGTEQRSDGIGFASRPSSLSFDYKYELKENMTDKGYALIEIIASDNSVIQHKKLDLDAVSEMKTVNVEFNYEFFGKKASKLIVHFKSSNKEQAAEIPIYIPSGSKLNEGQGLGNGKIDANSYKALATGSVLTIDNVKVHYDSGQTPANAKKRSIKKRK